MKNNIKPKFNKTMAQIIIQDLNNNNQKNLIILTQPM